MQYGSYQELASSRTGGRDALTRSLLGRASERVNNLKESTGYSRLANQIASGEDSLAGIRRNILDTDSNVTDRGRGSFMTEAQRQRQVVSEQQPLREVYARTQEGLQPVYRAYSSANEALQSGIRAGQIDDEREIANFDANTSLLERALAERLSAARAASQANSFANLFSGINQRSSARTAASSMPGKQEYLDELKKELGSLYKSGRGINDGTLEQIIQNRFDEINQSNPESGITLDELMGLAYGVRKPYENIQNLDRMSKEFAKGGSKLSTLKYLGQGLNSQTFGRIPNVGNSVRQAFPGLSSYYDFGSGLKGLISGR